MARSTISAARIQVLTRGLAAIGTAFLLSILVATPGFATSVILESSFVSSTSGTTLIGVGESIVFEQWITIEEGLQVSSVSPLLTGDLDGTHLNQCVVRCTDIQGQVTNWVNSDLPGPRSRNSGVQLASGALNEILLESGGNPSLALGNPVHLPFAHIFGVSNGTRYNGNGTRSLMGTVTITATAAGSFIAGIATVAGIGSVGGYDASASPYGTFPNLGTTNVGGHYSVHAPEPGTAVLMATGLAGLAALGRRQR